VRREHGLPDLLPFLKIGQIAYYEDDNIAEALGFSREAFQYALITFKIADPKRKPSYLGKHAVWSCRQGDKVHFSDSRTSMVGVLSHMRCLEYMNNMAATPIVKFSVIPPEVTLASAVVYKSVMHSLEYIGSLCVIHKAPGRSVFIEFDEDNQPFVSFLNHMEHCVKGKKVSKFRKMRVGDDLYSPVCYFGAPTIPNNKISKEYRGLPPRPLEIE